MPGPHRRLLDDEAGMVTVEAAYGIAAIVAVLLIGVGAVTAVLAQVRCIDAAREVARMAAVGELTAVDHGRRVAPSDASISLHSESDAVVAEVSATVPMLPLLRVRATAVAAREPGGGTGVVSEVE